MINEAFDHPHLFERVDMEVYGRRETVQLMAANLLWRPLGGRIVVTTQISKGVL